MPRAGATRTKIRNQRLQPKQEIIMADFLVNDLDTPTESDLDKAYGSKYLGATDVGARKIRTTIAKVRKADLRINDGTKRVKFVLHFPDIDKPMVLNATNKNELVRKLGKNPANWIGAFVGIYVDPEVEFGGKTVGGLRLRVLGPATGKPEVPAGLPEPPPHDGSGIEDMSDSIPL
jgi:hypothetical protein